MLLANRILFAFAMVSAVCIVIMARRRQAARRDILWFIGPMVGLMLVCTLPDAVPFPRSVKIGALVIEGLLLLVMILGAFRLRTKKQ